MSFFSVFPLSRAMSSNFQIAFISFTISFSFLSIVFFFKEKAVVKISSLSNQKNPSWELVRVRIALLLMRVSKMLRGIFIGKSSQRRCSIEEGVLKNLKKFTGKHLCQSLKRDSGTGILLWILLNFLEHLFYRTPPDDCFCIGLFCYELIVKL